ncbi:MAG: aminopeptidase P family protein [Clostridia bacterium]|nr:aminopeptidase P family protein [Clostridia bacterium]
MGRQSELINRASLTADEAILVHDRSDIFYLSGYTGEGVLLVSEGVCAVVTDFRYAEQAERESPDYVLSLTDSVNTRYKRVSALLQAAGAAKLRYQEDTVTVKELERMREGLPLTQLHHVGNVIEKMREIKDPGELSALRKAADITSKAFAYMLTFIREGLAEKEIALELQHHILLLGADSLAFPSIVAAGANGSLPHATPSAYRVRKGDMVTLDFGAKVEGYCSDMTRTVAVGSPGEEMRRVYQTVFEAQQMAEKALQAGKIARDVDAVARAFIEGMGYVGRFGHGLGHSLGIDIHENPRLSVSCEDQVREGHLFTVEPGVYLPGLGGVRIENTCIVGGAGAEPITCGEKELIIL